jgi:MFS superfamily sulfate permease-like transporter
MEIDKPKLIKTRSFIFIKHDLPASIVVFLVALPLCMGIALASGVPTEKAAAVGLMTGIIGGFVAGTFGGSCVQVSGPAAGLSVLVWELVQEHGWERIGLIVLLAGALQLAAGLFRLGQWFRAVAPAVVCGMLAGIGVLIFASQFHVMLDDRPKGSGLDNLLSLPAAFWNGIIPSETASHDDAARIGLLTILVIVLWKPLAPKCLEGVPAALVAVVLATVATVALELPIKQVNLPDNLLDAFQLPTLAGLDLATAWRPLLVAAASLSFIASAETLLSATAVDRMHQGPRCQYDRELIGQGLGNMVSGFLGALPITGVIVRSATNVEAGARTRASAILHGLWLLLFACVCPFVLRWVPTSSLAALLVCTGCKLVSPATIRTLWGYGRSEVLVYAVTLLTIVATDLLTGVLVGIGCALAKLVYTFSRLKIRLETDERLGRTILHLHGAATFLRLPKLAAALESVQPGTELHVRFEDLSYIDHACLDLLLNWEKQHEAAGGSLEIDWDDLHARFHHYGKRHSRPLATVVAPDPAPQQAAASLDGRG